MSFARGSSRLMTTATCGQHITTQRLSSISFIRPGSVRAQTPNFSRGQRRHFIEGTVQLATDTLVALHTTVGLPWYLAIPTAAMGVNLFVRLPLQIYARRVSLKQASLLPFLQAWRWRHAAMHDHATSMRQFAKSSRRIFRERRCQTWRTFAPLLGIPAWLVVPEALRRMSGLPGGLLSWITGGADAKSDGGVIPAFDTFDNSPAALPDASGLLDTATSAVQTAASGIEQSLMTGGVLWFHDLTAPDPYILLPGALAALMVYNMTPATPEQRRLFFNIARTPEQEASLTPAARLRLRVSRSLFVAALGFITITMQLPTAMLYYWVCASTFTSLNYLVLDAVMPIKNKNLPICKPRKDRDLLYIRLPDN